MSAKRQAKAAPAPIEIGHLRLDPLEFAVQASATLGMKESGKSYAATLFAERLHDAGIPFIAIDPIGIWRFMRFPRQGRGGRGYPIVVAGGLAGDLPLNPATAPAIVEAAMREGVSLVLDLFSMELSKKDWRRIVKDCVKLLLHRNRSHGLRYVFLEEAAEFVPQTIFDGEVYAEVEKLVRMGGNSRLGVMLISPRAQEINKAVLELCEHLFLFRQRGKNALSSLAKWLEHAGAADAKDIIATMPTLPQGECWAWIGGDHPAPPALLKFPAKRSLHPNRRVARGDEETPAPRGQIDVGQFVAAMQDALPQIAEQAAANDPKHLQRTIAKLQRELEAAQRHPAAPRTEARGLSQAQIDKMVGDAHRSGFIDGAKSREAEIADAFNAGADRMLEQLQQGAAQARARINPPRAKAIAAPPAKRLPPPRPAPARGSGGGSVQAEAPKPRPRPSVARTVGDAADFGPAAQVLAGLAWWAAIGINPTRKQLAGVIDVKPGGSTLRGYLAKLHAADVIAYEGGTICLTPSGAAIAPQPDDRPLHDHLRGALNSGQMRTFDAIVHAGGAIERIDLAEALEVDPGGSTLRGYLAALSAREIIEYAGSVIRLQPWAMWPDAG